MAQAGVQRLPEKKPRVDGEGEVDDLVFTSFGGMNVRSPRQSISDNQFFWLENVQPIAPGNLPVIPAPSAALQTYVGLTVTYAANANISGSDYIFSFYSDGSAYQTLASTPYTKTVVGAAGTFTSGGVAIAQWKNAGIVIIDSGNGYTDWNITAPNTLTVIDALTKGTSICSFAGRVWIGNIRTVKFTDVASYNSFGGAGGSFTISDETLHNNITALFPANNFMYIFGDDSIDVLGNVAVSGGATTFTRTNITASIGTNLPNSIFAYYRSIVFANTSGFYSLSGATPLKISDDLDKMVSQIDFTKAVSGAQFLVNNILCAGFLFTFNDTFTPAATSRVIMAVFFNNRWFMAAQGTGLKYMTSLPVSGTTTLFGLDAANLYQLFSSASGALASRIVTKLWDGGEPLLDKQILKVGLGVVYGGSGTQTLTVTSDNEMQSANVSAIGNLPAITWLNATQGVIQWQNALSQNLTFTISGYLFVPASAATGGGKYMGATITSPSNGLTFSLIALQYKKGKRW